ncbi:uncharacterized protein LOC123917346 [Trifolium pratense]|uniref:uncharacterized protein LOC123917346 n=1 Tax=Trifolium pratense TaxID=57577 RepID=UPI001E693405|nr:uncharacterized protein LOC123917346 [Trifolium pratense]
MENNKALIQGSSSMRQNDDELENEDSYYISSDEEDDDDDCYIDDSEQDECVDLSVVFPPETFCLVDTNVDAMTTNTPTNAADFRYEFHEDSDVSAYDFRYVSAYLLILLFVDHIMEDLAISRFWYFLLLMN